MNTAPKKSFVSAISIPFTLLSAGLMILFAFWSLKLISTSVTSSYIQTLQSKQKLFVEHIQQDLLAGAHYEVYRKCKVFTEDQDVVALLLRGLDGSKLCEFGVSNSELKSYRIISPIYFDDLREELATKLEVFYSGKPVKSVLVKYFLILLVTLVVLFVLQYFLARKISRILSKPISNLTQKFKGAALEELSSVSHREKLPKIAEIVSLYHGVEALSKKVVNFQEQLILREKEAALGKVTAQVAHDIRSPLSSMKAALEYLREMRVEGPKAPEVMNLLELSAKRLTGIADDLLKKHKGEGEAKAAFSLHQILDELIGEYQGRAEYKEVRFVKQHCSQAIQLFGRRTSLQRAFGNIVKNAVEAMEQRGSITIRTTKPNGTAQISITDTGSGIPADKLALILQGGFTEGKRDGHGIGMKVVRETIEEFGGKLTAQSELGKGTTFHIELPIHVVEESFTLEIASDKQPILVVDDEPSMREQWRLVLKDHGLKAILCESYEEVVRQKIGSALTQTAIVDYHFDNSEKSGADVAAYLQSQGFTHLVLCTAEYWKPSIQKLAQDLNVKLCPKPLPRIAILGSQAPTVSGPTVLVIDDDAGIRASWEVKQERLGIAQLYTYPNLEAIQSNGIDLSSIDIAFVDKNIENSKYTGAQVVNYLKDQGVPKVVLASGESRRYLQNDPQFARADHILGDKIPSSLQEFLGG